MILRVLTERQLERCDKIMTNSTSLSSFQISVTGTGRDFIHDLSTKDPVQSFSGVLNLFTMIKQSADSEKHIPRTTACVKISTKIV